MSQRMPAESPTGAADETHEAGAGEGPSQGGVPVKSSSRNGADIPPFSISPSAVSKPRTTGP
jgi:hypothetical protein